MPKPREIPSLDFLKGFDAAARHLSFTQAAAEMFLTQSALSRQIKTLEEQIGHPLFVRGHRELRLTEAGAALQPVVRSVLADLARSVASIRARHGVRRVSLSTTIPFASLWLIPRLPKFRQAHPDLEVFVSADNQIVDLERGEIDVAVRYAPEDRAPANATRLFGERVVPVVSPALLRDRARPLRRLADLAGHVLLHLEDPLGRTPWIDWNTWLMSSGVSDLIPAGNLRFSQYDLLLQAAVGGQGVALGRSPLIDHAVARGDLVMPFPKRYDSPRGYFAMSGAQAAGRIEVRQFIAWLRAEAAAGPDASVVGVNGVVKASPRRVAKRSAEPR
jgi:LysR family transcriptional regulator, glycine cleavage system transcriptional activator